jgi:intracellular multiplication protein IcmP
MKREVDGYVLKLAREMPGGKADFGWVEPLIERAMKSRRVKPLLERHAYVYTMMAGLLEEARTPGVLASCDFRWLKPKDRRLFYTMNCVGRRTAFAEVAGIFAHWLAEKSTGRALYVPYVAEAVRGLKEAMDQFVYEEVGHVRDVQEDHSESLPK